MEDAELLKTIKLWAKMCTHADVACRLVYYINNTTNADAEWRNWSCPKHHYGGSGAVPECPICEREAILTVPTAGKGEG